MDHESILGLLAVIQQELRSADVNIAKVSIALGSVESPLTKKDPTERCWPVDIWVSPDSCKQFPSLCRPFAYSKETVLAVLCKSVA